MLSYPRVLKHVSPSTQRSTPYSGMCRGLSYFIGGGHWDSNPGFPVYETGEIAASLRRYVSRHRPLPAGSSGPVDAEAQ